MSAWGRRDRLSKVQAEPDGEYARCAELPIRETTGTAR